MGYAGAGEKVVAVVEGGCFVCGWFDPRRLVLVLRDGGVGGGGGGGGEEEKRRATCW